MVPVAGCLATFVLLVAVVVMAVTGDREASCLAIFVWLSVFVEAIIAAVVIENALVIVIATVIVWLIVFVATCISDVFLSVFRVR